MSASYLVLLFVHSNSKWHNRICFLLHVSISMQLTLETSFIFEPSKYKVKILLATKILPIPLLLLLCTSILQDSFALAGEKGRSSNYVFGGTGDGYAC